MEPIITAGLVTAGANLLGQGANAMLQGKSNLRTRQFNEEMYLRQRKDALADWNMQAAYNSPAQQMRRYKEAGLNPHLIYGQPQAAPAPVRNTDVQPWHPTAPKFDLGSVAGQYFDTTQQIAQTDVAKQSLQLQKQQEKNLLQDGLNKAVQMQGMMLDNRKKAEQLPYAASLLKTSLDASATMIEKYQADIRAIDQGIEQSKATTLKIGQETQSIARDITRKDIENAWLPKEKELQYALGQANLQNALIQYVKTKAEAIKTTVDTDLSASQIENNKKQYLVLIQAEKKLASEAGIAELERQANKKGYSLKDKPTEKIFKGAIKTIQNLADWK